MNIHSCLLKVFSQFLMISFFPIQLRKKQTKAAFVYTKSNLCKNPAFYTNRILHLCICNDTVWWLQTIYSSPLNNSSTIIHTHIFIVSLTWKERLALLKALDWWVLAKCGLQKFSNWLNRKYNLFIISPKAFKFLSIRFVAELQGVSLLADFIMNFREMKTFPYKQTKVLFSGLRESRYLNRLLNKLKF